MKEYNLLVVDDSEVVHLAIHELIGHQPYNIISAYDGKEGIRKLGNNPVDLILSDITMPNKGGFEFCELVKSNPQFQDIPFIFLTASGNEEDILTGLDLGANDYIRKPFNEDELLLRMQTQLRLVERKNEAIKTNTLNHHRAVIATINHEVNNSLAILGGAVEKMKREKQFLPDQAEIIQDKIDYIANILKKLRDDSDFAYEDYIKGSEMLSLNK